MNKSATDRTMDVDAFAEVPDAIEVENISLICGQLSRSPHVDKMRLHTDEAKPYITVRLDRGIQTALDVQDILNSNNIAIRNPRITDDGMAFDIEADDVMDYVDSYPLRMQGDSYVVSLHRDAIEEAGFELGDEIEIHSADDSILLTEETG